MFGNAQAELEKIVENAKQKCDQLHRTADIAFKEAAQEILQDLHKDSKMLDKLYVLDSELLSIGKSLEVEQRKSKEQQEKKAVEKEYQTQLNWLWSGTPAAPQLPGQQQKGNLDRRQAGTCRWIFETEEYQVWSGQNSSSFLWISGEPGMGKSILVSSVIDFLEEELSLDKDTSLLVYFFCKTGNEATQRGLKIFLHLIAQLFDKVDLKDTVRVERCIDISKDVKSKSKSSTQSDSSHLTMKALQPLFEDLVRAIEKKVFVVVDAIDECADDHESQDSLLGALRRAAEANSDIRVLVSSRPNDDIIRALGGTPNIQVTKTQTISDVRAYLDGALCEIKRLKQHQRVRACNVIASKSDGMFRYANLAIDSLKQVSALRTPFDKLMEELPKGMEGFYQQKVRALDAERRDLLVIALRWRICGEGKIRASEIADDFENIYGLEEDADETDSMASNSRDTYMDSAAQIMDSSSTNDFERAVQTSESRESITELKKIGREFLKFLDDDVVELQHESVRDFVKQEAKDMLRKRTVLCIECMKRLSQDSTFKAAPKHGHLLMAERILRNLNSSTFQKQYILIPDGFNEAKSEGVEAQDFAQQGIVQEPYGDQRSDQLDSDEKDVPDEGEVKEEAEPAANEAPAEGELDNDNATDAGTEVDAIDTTDYEPREELRYELTHWGYHLREAEQAWREEERSSDQWDKLYQEVESFMSKDSTAFKHWQKKVFHWRTLKTFDHPLHIAARYGILGLMHRYLEQGVDVNMLNENGDTPIHLVSLGQGRFVGLEILLNAGADIHIRDVWQATPLLLLVLQNMNGVLEGVQLLLKHGADPGVPDGEGRTCLHWATSNRRLDICELLLGHPGLDVNARDKYGETALHWALQWSDTPQALVELLLDKGANVNEQDNDSQAPLYEACMVGNKSAAEILLAHGADVNDGEDVYGYTALHAAVSAKNLELVKLLVEKDADILVKNKQGRDPLAMAASEGETEILRFLIDTLKARGSDMHFLADPDIEGHTSLHRSAAKGYTEVVKLLLDAWNTTALHTLINQKGSTALHSAARRGRVEVVELLLRNNADPTITDHGGKTPLDLAHLRWKTASASENEAFQKTITILVEKAPVPAQNLDLFCTAIEKGAVDVCRHLLKLTNAEDEHGWTPLMLAIQLRQTDIIHLLSPLDSKHLLDVFSTRREVQLGHHPTGWSVSDKHSQLHLSEDRLEISSPFSGRILPLS